MTPARAEVAGVSAGYVALAGTPIADLEAVDFAADLHDLAGVLVSDRHGYGDAFLRPGVPVVDVHVGAADGRTMHLDEHIIVADLRFRDVLHPDARFRARLDQCLHTASPLMDDAELAPASAK